jgi:hypothetical protein
MTPEAQLVLAECIYCSFASFAFAFRIPGSLLDFRVLDGGGTFLARRTQRQEPFISFHIMPLFDTPWPFDSRKRHSLVPLLIRS